MKGGAGGLLKSFRTVVLLMHKKKKKIEYNQVSDSNQFALLK